VLAIAYDFSYNARLPPDIIIESLISELAFETVVPELTPTAVFSAILLTETFKVKILAE
jgi:hypothetical protein